MTVRFFVAGMPVPQGSLRSFAHRANGKVVTPQSPRVLVWRDEIAHVARKHCTTPYAVPVIVEADFWLPRPKAHFGSGRNAAVLKASAPQFPHRPPDIDKLCRAVLDGLAGVVFVDDALVVDLYATKNWAAVDWPVGVRIRVGEAALPGGDR